MHNVPRAEADTGRARAARRRRSTPASGDSQAAGGPARGTEAGGGMPEGPRRPARCRRPAPVSSEDCKMSTRSDHGPATVGTQRKSRAPSVSQPRKASTSWARVHSFHRRKRSSMAKCGGGPRHSSLEGRWPAARQQPPDERAGPRRGGAWSRTPLRVGGPMLLLRRCRGGCGVAAWLGRLQLPPRRAGLQKAAVPESAAEGL